MTFNASELTFYLPGVVALFASLWLLFDLRRLNREYAAKHDMIVDGWISRIDDRDGEYQKAFRERRNRLVSALLFGLAYTVFIYVMHGLHA